jgi:hypothetical protein
MTREETKTILKNAAWLGTHEDRDKVEQAVDMAISALEMNVPCSLCRFRYDNSGLCAKCPAMPVVRGGNNG